MAVNTTLRRCNGENYDTIVYVATDLKLVNGLLDNPSDPLSKIKSSLIPNINVTQVNGLLDSTSKFDSSLIPDYVKGGLKYKGSVKNESEENTDLSIVDLKSALTTITNDFSTTISNSFGGYAIISASGSSRLTSTISASASTLNINVMAYGNTYTYDTTKKGFYLSTDSDKLNPLKVESGDWIILDNYIFDEATETYSFTIANDSYDGATTTNRGIVKLADETAAVNLDNPSALDALTPSTFDLRFKELQKGSTGNNIDGKASNLQYGLVKIATIAQSTAGNDSDVVVTPAGVKAYADNAVKKGVEDYYNNQIDVSLDNFWSEKAATLLEATQGTIDGKYLSPKTGKALVDEFATIPLVTSESELNNLPKVNGKLALLQI